MNKVTLQAQLSELKPIRYTPAGVTILDMILFHKSEQEQAGHLKQVQYFIQAKAVGSITQQFDVTKIGQTFNFEGFLAPFRTNSAKLVLHIANCIQIKE